MRPIQVLLPERFTLSQAYSFGVASILRAISPSIFIRSYSILTFLYYDLRVAYFVNPNFSPGIIHKWAHFTGTSLTLWLPLD
jgi:hypothetical protein